MGHSIGSSMIDLRDGLAPGGLGDESRIFLGTDLPWDGPAGLLEPREVPQVWEVPALLRLHRLDGAIISFEEHTGAVGILRQRQTATVPGQPGEFLDERDFGHTAKRREAGEFAVVQPHLARPPAAGGAALALVEDRHGERLHGQGVSAKGGD